MNAGDHIDYELFDTTALLDALEDFRQWPHITKQTQALWLAVTHRLEVLEDIEKRLAAVPRLP